MSSDDPQFKYETTTDEDGNITKAHFEIDLYSPTTDPVQAMVQLVAVARWWHDMKRRGIEIPNEVQKTSLKSP